MDILQLIDRLEELFNESKSIPLTRNVMVDEDRMLELIDQMRIAIPEEVKKAQQLVAHRDRVMAQAQEESNRQTHLLMREIESHRRPALALQQAKQEGRNRYLIFDAEHRRQAAERATEIGQIQEGIAGSGATGAGGGSLAERALRSHSAVSTAAMLVASGAAPRAALCSGKSAPGSAGS